MHFVDLVRLGCEEKREREREKTAFNAIISLLEACPFFDPD